MPKLRWTPCGKRRKVKKANESSHQEEEKQQEQEELGQKPTNNYSRINYCAKNTNVKNCNNKRSRSNRLKYVRSLLLITLSPSLVFLCSHQSSQVPVLLQVFWSTVVQDFLESVISRQNMFFGGKPEKKTVWLRICIVIRNLL